MAGSRFAEAEVRPDVGSDVGAHGGADSASGAGTDVGSSIRPPTAEEQQALNALAQFLATPPVGTPPEVLRVLTLMAGDPGAPLPPRVYFETVEQAPVAISITDDKADILYVNAAFEQLTGYSRDQLIGRNQSILSSNATPSSIYQQLWRTIQSKNTWKGILVNRTRDGGDYLAELIISPVLDAGGRIRFFLGMHRDVTREHRLEADLRAQKIRSEAVLNAAPVLVALLNAEGRVVLDNMEYKKLLGDLRGEEPVAELRRALIEQAGFDPLERVLHGDGFKDVEISLMLPGSSAPRWFSCSGVAVNESDASVRGYFGAADEGEHRLLLLANDVTARRREIDRAHLEHLRARLAEQQLSEGVREALAAASYQIEQPLNLIRAATTMFGDRDGEMGLFIEQLRQISAASERALATLHAALPNEAPEAGVMVNINELLRHVLELETDRLLAAGVVIDWQPAMQLPELSGHRNQLRSLFKYLIDNALQALHESRCAQRELRLATRTLDDSVEVVIQDNGPGLPAADRLKAFEPFFVGWRRRRGRAGMGLALAQEIVNQHGGTIEIDDAFQDGCRIKLVLSHAPSQE
ncbi:nitrogen fixation negative regulator NifL [Thiorhodovibrio frisius]|uniref:histidine kinase n=1 Tax=Thiorhodovibrio frisius TaxID=631362 RepID=H8Z3P2_9GAMM|nr:nitrogen fixation negative regulator NifL [Thiorhodovibrio frisius]WPL20759.1 Nitrogen fixation regulatory protein [Thiorhodovibrio frisius]